VPEYTADVDALGVTRLLECIRASGLEPRFYQAGSSEMYGNSPGPLSEDSPMHPRSPYAAAKLYAHHMTRNYREAYGMFAVGGILFNHESHRRGATFVTRKITRAVANIKHGKQDKLFLGNLEARRDWGFAPDYVHGMWQMLQADKPDDYVLATGESHSVQEFAEHAFAAAELDWRKHVESDSRYLRPTEVDELRGDYSRARKKLGWEPKVKFAELVKHMVELDLDAVWSGRREFEVRGRHFE
jgi:GDPmannose 4,6-dehydratase